MPTDAVTLNQVAEQPVPRIPTGLDALDWVYGGSVGRSGRRVWGLPGGGVTLEVRRPEVAKPIVESLFDPPLV